MLLAIIIFHICIFSTFIVINNFEFEIQGFFKILIFGMATFFALYLKIKKDGRLLNMTEKIIFTISTWGIYTALIITTILMQAEKTPTTPGILFVAFETFWAFCGIWLVISTLAAKCFEKQIKNA